MGEIRNSKYASKEIYSNYDALSTAYLPQNGQSKMVISNVSFYTFDIRQI